MSPARYLSAHEANAGPLRTPGTTPDRRGTLDRMDPTWRVIPLLNVTTDLGDRAAAWIHGWTGGNLLATDPALLLHVTAATPRDAVDAAWTIANRGGTDLRGTDWPSWCRSASVGDVFTVTDAAGAIAGVFACRPLGWEALEAEPSYAVGRDALASGLAAAP